MSPTNTFSRLRHLFHYGSHAQPARDWFALLGVTAILLIVSVAGNAWIFHRVVTGGMFPHTATSTPPVFTNSSIDVVEKVFAERAAQHATYAAGGYVFTDPSK